MAMQDQDFWRRLEKGAPGLFDLGAGLYSRNAANKEAGQRIGELQAVPGYGELAQQRTNDQLGLLEGKDAADEASLLRMLHAKGMLGAANFNPGVEGITPSGTAMNPHMAAFYAARNARNSRVAADSLDQAERMRAARRAEVMQEHAIRPSKSAQSLELLRGLGGIAKDTGLFGAGVGWLKNLSGGGGAFSPFGGFDDMAVAGADYSDLWNRF